MSGQVICTVCKVAFQSRNKLFMHISAAHTENNRIMESNKRKCTESELTQNSVTQSLEEQIQIVEEDDSYRIIVKPQGLATMGGKGPTLINSNHMLLPNAIELMLSYKKAVPCHRLDKETGGLVVCSKNKQAEIAFNQCFRNKYVYKKYVAIVAGKIEPAEGYINIPLWNKKSVTRYKVSEYTNSIKYGTLTTVTLYPITGRKHQLRRHLQLIGHSIIGDKRYSHCAAWPDNTDKMFLFSTGVELPHPSEVERVISLCGGSTSTGSTLDVEDDDNDCCCEEDTKTHENVHSDDTIVSVDHTLQIEPQSEQNTALAIKSDDVDNHEQYDGIGYGCVRSEYVTHNIKMIRVEIDEPEYYGQFRQYHEQQWASSQNNEKSSVSMTGNCEATTPSVI